MELILLNVLNAMLNPFLFYAAVSFVVAYFAMHADDEKALPTPEEKPQSEDGQLQELKPEEAKP